MALPLRYNIRSVLVRWRSTLSTIVGVALVVAVYVLVQSLAAGIEKSASNTGDERNWLVVRKGATSESSSIVSREQFKILEYLPEVAKGEQGNRLISADTLLLISLPRRNGSGNANVLVRGVTKAGLELRTQLKLTSGRWFIPSRREVVVPSRLAARFADLDIGSTFKTGGNALTVVGWTDGGRSAFDSEIWMDADEARSLFDRESYSSVVLRTDAGMESSLTNRIETDKRLNLQVVRETAYYAEQTMTSKPISIIGKYLAIAMSIGAMFAAMNTMYASVGARTREVGTLRVLGFRRRSILFGFILEGAVLSLMGGALGVLLSLPMNHYSTGTFNFQSFSEVVFEFQITPALMVRGLLFSVIVGVVGSLLPAIRAARLPVIASLKSL